MIWLTIPLCLWALASCVCLVAFTTENGSPWLVIPAAILVPPLIVIVQPMLFVLEQFCWLMARLVGETE